MTSMDFIDATGEPRPDTELEQALEWVKKKIIRPDFKDPEGVILCVTIKDALMELLVIRRAIAKEKAESKEGKLAEIPAPQCEHVWEADGDRDVCKKCGTRANPVM